VWQRLTICFRGGFLSSNLAANEYTNLFAIILKLQHQTRHEIYSVCVPCIACPDLSGSIAAHTIVSSRFCGTSCLKIPKIQIKIERLYNSSASFFPEGEPSKASSFIPIKSIN
jgi:hypothetical protein